MAAIDNNHNLLSAYQGGDLRAFERLYTQYAPRLLGYALSLLGDRDGAEDILQKVFTAFIRRAPQLPPETRVGTYLFAAARNHIANAYRSRERGERFARNYEVFVRCRSLGSDDPAENAETGELLQEINGALAHLSVKERDVILLRTQGGLSFTDIAKALGRPRGTVATQYRAAIAKLRHLLAKVELEP